MLRLIKKILQVISNYGNKKWHQKTYRYALYILYILYATIFSGLFETNYEHLDILEIFVKYYVSLFLIARFNPLVKTKFTKFDAEIAFSSGVFLLITTSAYQIAKKYISSNINY